MLKEPEFPSTRFIGSKTKILDWIWQCIQDLNFEKTLEPFGGTGAFSFYAKKKRKTVYYNDILTYNYNSGLALIENSSIRPSFFEIENCLKFNANQKYSCFISKTFQDIYFTNGENAWLDVVVQNINLVEDKYKKAILIAALGQACLIKRPFNLFHRKNLYLRLNNVERTFNNKTCWDTNFEFYFKKFIDQYNNAVFSNGKCNKATNLDVFDLSTDFDLVYLDPPYMSGHGVNYLEMYHFLEGIVSYDNWSEKIDYTRKNRAMRKNPKIDAWTRKENIPHLLEKVIEKFSGSKVILSYRGDGYPSKRKISNLFLKYTGKKPAIYSIPYKYVLSERKVSEILFVSE
ncbi:MAG: DNA adenine methylase [Candidatus Bathyarchaeota archaeon]|nr:DNA adenine methylase [Candidatus Bathyarchaeota archaeon]